MELGHLCCNILETFAIRKPRALVVFKARFPALEVFGGDRKEDDLG